MPFRDVQLDTIKPGTSVITIITFVLFYLGMQACHVPRDIPLPWTFVVAELTVENNSLMDILLVSTDTTHKCCLKVTTIKVALMHNFLMVGSFVKTQQPLLAEVFVTNFAGKLYPLCLS